MTVPPSAPTETRGSSSSQRLLAEPPLRRLPILMRLLAILSLAAGMWGAVAALTDLMGGVRADRTVFINRVREQKLALYDKLQTAAAAPAPGVGSADGGTAASADGGPAGSRDGGTAGSRDGGTASSRDGGTAGSRDGGTAGSRDGGTAGSRDGGTAGGPSPVAVQGPAQPLLEPLLQLPRSDIENLSLLLGDLMYTQLPVVVPLALLQILLSWLLLTGSLGVLRRQAWALSMWSWGCMANIPFALLSILVTFVHSRAARDQLGPKLAAALAKVSGRTVETELYNVHQMVRLYVGGQAAIWALWVLLLGTTVLYLQRYVVRGDRP